MFLPLSDLVSSRSAPCSLSTIGRKTRGDDALPAGVNHSRKLCLKRQREDTVLSVLYPHLLLLNGRITLPSGYILHLIVSARTEFESSLGICFKRQSGPKLAKL